ncbi:DUF1742-domain-containing protein [Metschnikowia bicuspidata var. bicuspidata NRRL YB-4993]|uniref:DUF1742-domain-containing protein n=1 Tax=Metschnikowia bicuspidata var. bicuspidata NRRL YB-4993 TaxID=869754 RepID=A0A1A0H6C3_9ASCO|nr:DUF1742-domain-containing protein [Metschnikowia bicuspidata var. bicuspidata NRRL YB-4993]OBA19510.1 DUF1742-domain-containing protein [Metschnikowia bicuspidata var. bicuspidata NRRL YB-4993]
MSAPPFPNEYRCRLVADSDSKPCTICFKPTSTVLLASNKADHFYVCPMHMKDKSFASPIILEDYTKLMSEKTRLENEVRLANSLADANRPYSWTKLMSNIGWSDPVQPRKENSEDKPKLDDAESSQAKKQKQDTYEELVSQANSLKTKLADVNSSIAGFQFKHYALAKDVYKMRVNSSLQGRNRVQKQSPGEASKSVVFPSVPKSDIS